MPNRRTQIVRDGIGERFQSLLTDCKSSSLFLTRQFALSLLISNSSRDRRRASRLVTLGDLLFVSRIALGLPRSSRETTSGLPPHRLPSRRRMVEVLQRPSGGLHNHRAFEIVPPVSGGKPLVVAAGRAWQSQCDSGDKQQYHRA